jgi:3-hydroxypropanoate dehydrogenase
MTQYLSEAARDRLFRTARSYNSWLDRPVADDLLLELYDLLKWGPTSANSSPMRVLFLRTKEAKERLQPALSPRNAAKTLSAPVTAIVAYDLKFHDQLPKLLPHNPGMRAYFVDSPALIEATAQRNSALQGAYLMIAARALGLDCGPMSGFDNAKVDEEFFAKPRCTAGRERLFFPDGDLRSNFLCNLGYGDPLGLFPRSPRLDFSEACALL